MLGLARRVKDLVLLDSTSEVYGNPEIYPQTEKYNGNAYPLRNLSYYDEGKIIPIIML